MALGVEDGLNDFDPVLHGKSHDPYDEGSTRYRLDWHRNDRDRDRFGEEFDGAVAGSIRNSRKLEDTA